MTSPALARPLTPDLARVERTTEVPPALAEEFLAVYRAAFAPLEVRAAARQSLTDEEFREEMTDPRVLKFVAYDAQDEAAAMSMVATDLSVVPWISVPYYAHRFPEHHARGTLFYAGALVVRPDRQGGPWSKMVVDEVFRFVAEHRALLAFDCCGYNVDVVKFPDTSARAAHRIAFVENTELDQQRYYALDMAGGLR
jgi:hypothetical protein